MARSRVCWIVLAAALACPGCPNPATTRLPSCRLGPAWAERASLSHYDPLPDRDLGPETDSRPRWFMEGRTQERQALEGQALPAAPARPPASGYSSGAYRNSAVVR